MARDPSPGRFLDLENPMGRRPPPAVTPLPDGLNGHANPARHLAHPDLFNCLVKGFIGVHSQSKARLYMASQVVLHDGIEALL